MAHSRKEQNPGRLVTKFVKDKNQKDVFLPIKGH